MGKLGVGGSGGGIPQGRRASDDELAHDAERRNDAGAVENSIPGGDRCGMRAHRFLAIQSVLRATAVRSAAVERSLDVEPARLSPARGIRLRRHAVQLHVDSRKSSHRTSVDGKHGYLEARIERDAEWQ